MDEQRFDNLTRRLATSRRGLFKFLAVGVAAGVTRPLQGGFHRGAVLPEPWQEMR